MRKYERARLCARHKSISISFSTLRSVDTFQMQMCIIVTRHTSQCTARRLRCPQKRPLCAYARASAHYRIEPFVAFYHLFKFKLGAPIHTHTHTHTCTHCSRAKFTVLRFSIKFPFSLTWIQLLL